MLIELKKSGDSKDNQIKDDNRNEAYFNAEQNAIVAKNAKLYYRTMIKGGAASWNVRDHHTMNTLERLMKFHGKGAKSIVWAHNTHIGDARATDMHRARMVNLGQLVREQAEKKNVALVEFGTYRGTVIASKEWGDKMEKMQVPPAIDGSWDSYLHNYNNTGNSNNALKGSDNKLLIFKDTDVIDISLERRGQRAIGVVYNPHYEYGNYVETILPSRYDALLFFDITHALHPLHMLTLSDKDLPETFPTGR